MFNVHENPVASYLLPLAMTLVGAASFAWLRSQERRAPLEAFIGIVFATAQAPVFLVLEKTPSGPEHLKETLVGALYTVDPARAKTAVLYAVIGAVHLLLRRPFFEITNDPEGARARGRRLFLWDFLFYGLFGVVVTSSVQIAGVLLVFGLLVIPAVAGLLASAAAAIGARGRLGLRVRGEHRRAVGLGALRHAGGAERTGALTALLTILGVALRGRGAR